MPPSGPDPAALKRRLSARLLGVEGVSGVGLPGGRLTVYLVSDSEEIRRRVREVVEQLAPGAEPLFEVTGPLRPQL
jgi:hypothetical protein